MAGMKGFEPLHGGFRVHSLTAWLHPNDLVLYILPFFQRKSTLKIFLFLESFRIPD